MKHFTPFFAPPSGKPLLFLHGLGSATALDPVVEKVLTDLGYSVSSLLRDDAVILSAENPHEIYQDELSQMVEKLHRESGESITLVGNSLGSYIALLSGLEVSQKVKAVLGLDAFLTPRYGFAQMQLMSEKMETHIHSIPPDSLTDFGKRYKDLLEQKNEENFIIPLVDGFIEIPTTVSNTLPDIAEIPGSQEIPFPVALVYAAGDSFLSPSKPPHTLISGENITHFEISHILDDNGNEKRAEHNDWKKSPEAIEFATNFLRNSI